MLTGDWKDHRDCHVKPDLVLIYRKPDADTLPWVFPNPLTGQPYRRDANTAWRTARKKAGIENLHFHDTRHTTASHLRMQGADLLTIQEILGHKDLRMTARYAHVGQAHNLTAIGLLEKAYKQEPRQKKADNQ